MSELPRERLKEKGANNLTNQELISILLRTGSQGINVFDLSKEILDNFSLMELSRMSVEEISNFKGISFAKASTLVSAFELSRRLIDNYVEKVSFSSPKEVVNFSRSYFLGLGHERVIVIFVTSKNTLIKSEVLNEGSIDYSIIDTKKLVKRAMDLNSSGFFLLHNHPSGDSSPSREDKEVTGRVKEVCELLNLRFLDHIVYGSNDNFFSFFDNDML